LHNAIPLIEIIQKTVYECHGGRAGRSGEKRVTPTTPTAYDVRTEKGNGVGSWVKRLVNGQFSPYFGSRARVDRLSVGQGLEGC